MKNLISFLIFLLFAWLGIWWYYSCDWCSENRNGNSQLVEEKPNPEAEALAKKAYEDSIAYAGRLANGLFAIDDLNQDVFRYPDNLQINNRDGNVHIPASLNNFSDKIASYLGQYQNKELIIYGYETLKEQESDTLYGLNRANYIKDILITAGVNGDRLVPKAKLVDYTYQNDGIYKGGIHFNFHKLDQSRLDEVEKGIANKILYSDFGEKEFIPDATLNNYTLELKNYLSKYPNKKVQITGHTDDKGENETNQWFGQQRADNVKNHFISNGISSDKLKANSKGESNPIVPNTTKENRSKNRRIEIIVN